MEPLSIPDVLAERPVTVFGKWRGDPRGKITLEGHAGKQKFSQTVDVGAVQPLDLNAPLRYLWARQRIATLSDYNRIQPDDGRVATVRELGLQYHLLTAYTSFVAVDTLVRRTGEPATTVQQPLPLPEGVSDLALGRAMQVAAPRSLLFLEKTPPTPHGGKEALEGEEKEGTRIPGRGSVHDVHEEMTVSGGLSREAVVETVRRHLPEMEKCYEIALQRDSSLKGGMILKFVLDAEGTVQKVQIISSEMASTDLEACLKERLKTWKFPSLTEGSTAEVTYPFTFGLP
jgi:Ca-activated chloride channel family protein